VRRAVLALCAIDTTSETALERYTARWALRADYTYTRRSGTAIRFERLTYGAQQRVHFDAEHTQHLTRGSLDIEHTP
jgi:hypothetical protein